MSILDRVALEDSPLADLHAIASELSLDGFRRLRRPELINAILERQAGGSVGESGDDTAATAEEERQDDDDERPSARRRRGRRGGRGRAGGREGGEDEDAVAPDEEGEGGAPDERVERDKRPERVARDKRPERRERAPRAQRAERDDDAGADGAEEIEEQVGHPRQDEVVEGVVELLPNGSAFLRVNPPDPSDEDVYVSAAQVKRCELVSGDRVAGPRRAPRRSERFASLIRVDTINGRDATEVADSVRFEDLPASFPTDRFRLGSEDPTIKAIEWLTPFGRGSRVTITGDPQAGKTEALRRLASALATHEDIQLLLVLAGVRPEEIPEWSAGSVEPAVALSIAASPDAQAQTVEGIVEQARRLAARGANAVVLIDTLEAVPAHAARKALAAARNIVDGGSLTVIATAPAPLGGETTLIALDAALASTGRFPAVDLARSWTMHAELLVGAAGAEAIARAREEAVEN